MVEGDVNGTCERRGQEDDRKQGKKEKGSKAVEGLEG